MGLLDQLPETEPELDESDDKTRLFQTVKRMPGSSRNYLKVLLAVAALVIVGGIAFAYWTLPGKGDSIRAPKGLELAVRNHLLDKEKRTATDIVFFQCDGFIWSRSGVETRTDIPNPIFRIGSYSTRSTPSGPESWEMRSKPISSPEENIPCS